MQADLPNLIQASAAVVIVALTAFTLVVLRGYAADTKTIAGASLSQLENSQMPFLAVVNKPPTANETNGWTINNQGVGSAINGTMIFTLNQKRVVPLPCIPAGGEQNVDNHFSQIVANRLEAVLEYESLSGLKYSTLIRWNSDGMGTTFQRPVRDSSKSTR